ncbi:MAG: type II toxin-antitoxin system HicA family toxin [Candidatus Cloacimonetes bacterium]|nr:type II toxin-antitoxin system HicA family toxin [Candidatus Cloacimonadota bacterium]MCF7814305.1 type II toxin-antitoxin system HicA family toxin [Candidatus Cloacimonadota bacterium]MCF7868382.1 type II toxin-antitoxin system HicA family toxin [Candidatus Cloacimonadota bacterium]MCF7883853.1 type II toxin-antitoxin system HicA family toxin [Candidatus Cloacimonadota bacterium]
MLALYIKAGWQKLSSKGSHVKVGKGSSRQIIPMHKELKKGIESKLLKFLKEEK